MTPIGPVPFVGRQHELTELKEHLAVVSLVSVHGALGSGKTRLVAELAAALGAPCSIVECFPGDRASAVRARAERALRCVPGTLAQLLGREARVLVIDDIQHLRVDEATNLLAPLQLGQTALGRVLVVGRDPLAAAVGASIAELELAGLDVEAASQMWSSLEELFGPVDGFDAAYSRTRGIPLALRREYARARFGAQAWEVGALDAPARAALDALAILRQPVAPAAVAALAPGVDTEAALTGLVARQLVDAVGDGRIVLHEVVRADVLAQMSVETRHRLSAAAAELVASTAAVAQGPRLAWQAGDDGAFGAMDQITRVREVAWHWLAAGDRARAADTLLADRELAARSGGAGEFEALLDALGDRPRRRAGTDAGAGAPPSGSMTRGAGAGAPPSGSMTRGAGAGAPSGSTGAGAGFAEISQTIPVAPPLDAERQRALAALRIEIAVRGGRFTEAFERAAAMPAAVSPLLHAELTLASGDATGARRALHGLVASREAGERARALAMLAELELLAGKPDTAAGHLVAIGDLAAIDPLSRARVHLASARLDEYAGRVAAMRAALARAHGACKSVPACLEASELSAVIDARRAIGLAREGRLIEAQVALDAADAVARDLDSVAVSDEALAARALVARRRGDSATAAQQLQDLVRGRRERGDELGALRAELDLAELEILRGQPALAAELASAALASSVRRELGHLAARGSAVVAAIDLIELRLDAALPRLEELYGQPALDAASAAQVAVLLATARALAGQRAGALELAQSAGVESRDELDRRLSAAEVALATGDVGHALELARDTAVLAERAHRTIELASALVIVARLELARGDRGNARSAATRAAREAASAGLVRVRVHALLALSALARDDDDPASAVAYARDASELALTAGLPVERLVAHAALDAISGHEAVADPSAPSAATMAPTAIEGAARLLTDLGLTAQRPFRVIDSEGVPSDVADANPEILRLPGRALAVDGVREVIWRHGAELADLRRRSLLKRLLFLFASAPGKVFSKEAIVQAVWNVEYHPLRHDAALFTNIMRIRRLLGEDGSEIIRVTEDGYRFVPPRDFLFVIPR
ncbi:MAG TPA: winged helix-turn-helix domain-containing protein [Kofleriaceae bacterium]|nr:winged helix-turn-helix domain-containing protein [Kofleriaceae bacterium]